MARLLAHREQPIPSLRDVAAGGPADPRRHVAADDGQGAGGSLPVDGRAHRRPRSLPRTEPEIYPVPTPATAPSARDGGEGPTPLSGAALVVAGLSSRRPGGGCVGRLRPGPAGHVVVSTWNAAGGSAAGPASPSARQDRQESRTSVSPATEPIGKVRQFQGHETARVESVCVARDGRHALSAGQDWKVRYWDVETGQESGHQADDNEAPLRSRPTASTPCRGATTKPSGSGTSRTESSRPPQRP